MWSHGMLNLFVENLPIEWSFSILMKQPTIGFGVYKSENNYISISQRQMGKVSICKKLKLFGLFLYYLLFGTSYKFILERI